MTIERGDASVPVPGLPGSHAGVTRDGAPPGEECLLDRAHATWRVAQGDAQHALEAWLEVASGAPARGRHRAYVLALEREEAAARTLQQLHEHLRLI